MEMEKLVPAILRTFDIEWANEESSDWAVKTFWFVRQEGLIYRLKSRK